MQKLRLVAATLAALILFVTAGCSSTVNSASRQAPMPGPQSAPRQGLSTKQKVLLVAGAAALYYMYKKHQNAQGAGPQGQYYRSKNGRIYYRDRSGNPVWVTAPEQPMEVPADEYERVTGQRAPDSNNGGVIRQAPAGW